MNDTEADTEKTISEAAVANAVVHSAYWQALMLTLPSCEYRHHLQRLINEKIRWYKDHGYKIKIG